MKVKRRLSILVLFLALFLLNGCAKESGTIDENYWKEKLKSISVSDNMLDTVQDKVENLTEKGADATKDLYNALGISEEEHKDFFTNIGSSIVDCIKQWSRVDSSTTPIESEAPEETEADILQTSILEDAANSDSGRVKVALKRVVDGDTLIVIYKNDSLRVRLIGINTPESVHNDASKNTPEGEAASNYLKEFLKDTEFLWLEFDEDPQDDYGRALAYVWLNEEGTNIEQDLLNGVIIKSGHGELMTIEPNTKYYAELAGIK